jgi:hypothetical protein
MGIWKTLWVGLVCLSVGAVAVMVLAPSTAWADPYVINFDLQEAQLTYSASVDPLTGVKTGTLIATETAYSPFAVWLNKSGATIDRAKVTESDNNMPFDFNLTLSLQQLGTEQWLATGSLKFTDTSGSGNAVEAKFVSTDIIIYSGASYTLNIIGGLSPLSGPSILTGYHGDPWTFMGDPLKTNPAQDADGVLGQITLPDNRLAYTGGDLFVIKTDVSYALKDLVFGSTWTGEQTGEVKGTVVPAPAAVVLGLFGLGVVGWYMRRFA